MAKENVLVLGAGGREHALAWALQRSPIVGTVYCAPGNGGMGTTVTLLPIDIANTAAVLSAIEKNKISLTVIGPEAPLVAGLSDALRALGHLVVGASQKAAELEGSKVFAKEFMKKYAIPTADFKIFDNADAAKAFVKSPEGREYLVVKADGLAAGKGVVVGQSPEDVTRAIQSIMEDKKFGAAGKKILLEKKLEGPEVSIIALTDGNVILPFPSSQDHKRASDGDMGPNTGGMGAYAPTPFFNESVRMATNKNIFDNFLRGLKTENLDFRGFIYFGLMLTATGPKVLEFNVRFGDPEAQAVLPLVESDLYEIFKAVAEGHLAKVSIQKRPGYACTVVMASGGYPDAFEKGLPITGIEEAQGKENVIVFHAGTLKNESGFVTNGGRVLNVTGVGRTLESAVVRAYQGVKKISFHKAHYRNDIAARALKNPILAGHLERMKKRHVKKMD